MSRQAHETESSDGRIRELKSHAVGVPLSRGVHPQVSTPHVVCAVAPVPWGGVPSVSGAEGESGGGRAPDAGSPAHDAADGCGVIRRSGRHSTSSRLSLAGTKKCRLDPLSLPPSRRPWRSPSSGGPILQTPRERNPFKHARQALPHRHPDFQVRRKPWTTTLRTRRAAMRYSQWAVPQSHYSLGRPRAGLNRLSPESTPGEARWKARSN